MTTPTPDAGELMTAEQAAALLEFYRQFKRVIPQDKAEDDASAALRTIIALHEALAAAEARHDDDRQELNRITAELGDERARADAAEARVAVLESALKRAADQLSRVHDDAFTQCAGWALVRSDGKAFSCMEINRCDEVARKSRAALETGAGDE